MRRRLRHGAMETMIFFLLQLVYPASFLFGLGAGEMAIGVACLAAFGACYVVAFVTPASSRWRIAAFGGQLAILLFMMAHFSLDYVYLLFYPAATILYGPRRRTAALFAVLCISVALLVAALRAEGAAFPTGFGYLLAGSLFGGSILIFMMRAWDKLAETNARLEATQSEVARLSQAEERMRIGRDLHDLLGHQLSLITLKAQVAARMLERTGDIARARAEIDQIERVSRATLESVRAYVADMRALSWQDAWRAAEEVLAAAGIEANMTCEWGALPRDAEHAFAMGLREAVTNVVRHSGAGRCAIRAWRTSEGLVLAVADDGAGQAECGRHPGGSGIPGMRARMAQIGGTCECWDRAAWNRRTRGWPSFDPGWVVVLEAPVPVSLREGLS
ncbi:sensor histidine kinase [Alicyclobacillus vulcanalis]|uniref:histidine kinase n=1 Tax=Alicyclobacillus vulcanalis TaxID=252246 RepID=A0A1N7NZ79_9BACL|nr:histidine kinase [Alicyclobacillus vulcanalis]SIT03634.1 two-component system, NarL family, sensor histidine kinase DesK [Alicyclobacillus vulcanalis]